MLGLRLSFYPHKPQPTLGELLTSAQRWYTAWRDGEASDQRVGLRPRMRIKPLPQRRSEQNPRASAHDRNASKADISR